jgi:hypothetical protein
MGTCDYCGDKVDHLYASEDPDTFKIIRVCEECEWGPVNGSYYEMQSYLNSD